MDSKTDNDKNQNLADPSEKTEGNNKPTQESAASATPWIDPQIADYIEKTVIPTLPPNIGDELRCAILCPDTDIAKARSQSESYIIIVCAKNADPNHNILKLRKSKTMIKLKAGVNILTIEQFPDLKNGFYPIQKGRNVLSANQNCQSIIEIDLSNFDASEVESTQAMFDDMFALRRVNLTNVIFSKVRNMDRMFSRCISLREIKVNRLDTFKSDVLESSICMFFWAASLKSLGLPYFGGRKLKSIIGMFEDMESLEKLDLSGWNLRGVAVESPSEELFFGCKSLKKIYMLGCSELSYNKIQKALDNSPEIYDVSIVRAMFGGAK